MANERIYTTGEYYLHKTLGYMGEIIGIAILASGIAKCESPIGILASAFAGSVAYITGGHIGSCAEHRRQRQQESQLVTEASTPTE